MILLFRSELWSPPKSQSPDFVCSYTPELKLETMVIITIVSNFNSSTTAMFSLQASIWSYLTILILSVFETGGETNLNFAGILELHSQWQDVFFCINSLLISPAHRVNASLFRLSDLIFNTSCRNIIAPQLDLLCL